MLDISWWIIAAAIFLGACQPQPNQVFIEVDGRRQALSTEVTTVREALDEATIILEPLDKVSPDLYVQLEPGLVIVVTRVTEEVETHRELVPFERQTVVNEALQPGETRIAQLGVNGEDEISVRVTFEDGVETNRQQISREVIIEAAPEILIVGPQGELPPTEFAGTIAYLSNGNAWLMRENTGSRRALTTEGDLDGRVFSLSPDGRQLAYTREVTNEVELPLNELWIAPTTIVGEPPTKLEIEGILTAEWSPDTSQNILAYSTAKRSITPPGWRANNDLWLLTVSDNADDDKAEEPRQILSANTQGLYPWWGTTFTWSPNGQYLAYARPDQIGVIDLTTLTDTTTLSTTLLTPIADFAPLQTFSEWVWVPQLTWSPDSNFIAATIHGDPIGAESAEESQVFDLWLFNRDGQIAAKVVDQVGMWSNPRWGPEGIVFGEAELPLNSVNSRYVLNLIDWDGSNKRRVFPLLNETGVRFPEMVWAPDSDQILFVNNNNLFLTSSAGSPPRQLTSDAQATLPQWVIGATLITNTNTITASVALTSTVTITPTVEFSETNNVTITVTPTQTNATDPEPTATFVPITIEEQLKGE